MKTRSTAAATAWPGRWLVLCLLSALAAGQICNAEHLVYTTSGINGQVHSNEPVEWLGKYYSAERAACFIATAAYRPWRDPHLEARRRVHDRSVLPQAASHALMRFYYSYSPPVSEYIAQHTWLKTALRIMLAPIVGMVEHPLFALLITMIVGLAGLILIRYLRHHPD